MFNELKRYFYYRKQYKFDSLCDAIYTLIFIVGIIMIFSGQTLLNILYFYIYFLVTNITLLANEELEYEIRTSQYDNLITSKYKVKRIYLRRIVAYLVWSSILLFHFLCQTFLVVALILYFLKWVYLALLCLCQLI